MPRHNAVGIPGLGFPNGPPIRVHPGSPLSYTEGVVPSSPGVRRPRRDPGYGRQVGHNPEGGCAERPNGGHEVFVECVDIGHSLRVDSSSAPANPIPFRPLISHPPTGTNGTTPCGVGNPMWPGPGVVRRPAQPRALWHNVVDVGEGKCVGGSGLSHLPRGLENISRRGCGAEKGHLEPLRLSHSAGYIPFHPRLGGVLHQILSSS